MAADIQGYSTSGTTITGTNTWTALSAAIPLGQTRTYTILLIGRTVSGTIKFARKYFTFSVFNNAGTAVLVDVSVNDITPEYIEPSLTGLNFQVSLTVATLTVIVGGPTAGTAMQWAADIQWSQF